MPEVVPVRRTSPAVRQVSFFAPASGVGKWHAASSASRDVALCGAGVALAGDVIRSVVGKPVHAVVCGRCVRHATYPGYSARGLAS